MKGLILNDFLSMRKLLKSILLVFFAFAAIWGFMDQPETGAIIICVMGISYLFNLFTYDEYYHWDQYRSILPVTHKDRAGKICSFWYHFPDTAGYFFDLHPDSGWSCSVRTHAAGIPVYAGIHHRGHYPDCI